MAILARSWLTFTAIIATVLAVLTFLSSLQYDAILSGLIQQRLSVVAQSTADSFRSVVDLGLPLKMVRNANTVLARARQTDPRIAGIHVLDPAGRVVHSTGNSHAPRVSKALLPNRESNNGPVWSVETESEFISGVTITDASGAVVGNVVVEYAKDQFDREKASMAARLSIAATTLLVIFSSLTFFILRHRLAGANQGLRRLDGLLEGLRAEAGGSGGKSPKPHAAGSAKIGFLDPEIDALESRLTLATRNFQRAQSALDALTPPRNDVASPTTPDDRHEAAATSQMRETSIARLIAQRLVPWAALLILGSAAVLGYFTITAVNQSIEPELNRRTKLIGTIVSGNIQHAVSAGVPLDSLVGAKQYFGNVLHDFPEISYIGVISAQGGAIIESGIHRDRPDGKANDTQSVLDYPITSDGARVGSVIVETNPGFVTQKFRDVLLDLAVVTLVAILLAFEIMISLMSVTLTAPLVRLQRLVALQGSGDFSKRLKTTGRNAIDRLGAYLTHRTELLHSQFLALNSTAGAEGWQDSLLSAGRSLGLSNRPPQPLVIHFANDIRLPLFVFVMAEELATPFLPLFTRANSDAWLGLSQGVVISLPIMAYLVAIVVASPFARALTDRVGHRGMFLLALVPGLIDNLGLYWSSTVAEIMLWRSFTGVGYALATLACQDYVLDLVPREQRSRAINMFIVVVISGTFCGTAVGGILAERLGPRNVFLIGAALVVLAGFLAYRLLGEAQRQSAGFGTLANVPLKSIRNTLMNPRFAALTLGIAVPANVLLAAFLWYLVPLTMNSLGASIADIGRSQMLYYFLILATGAVVARFADLRTDPAVLAAIGGIVSGVALLLPSLAPTQWSVVLAVCGAGLGHAMVRAPQVGVAITLAETELSDAGTNVVLGALRTLERLGSVVGLLGIAVLSDVLDYEDAIAAIGILILCTATPFLIMVIFGAFRRNA